MNTIRNLWVDLVDRKLWPVAVGLVAMLIAIPVLLAKSSPETTVAPRSPAATSASPSGATKVIADVSGTAYSGPVKGTAKDPFAPKRLPSARATGAAGAAAGGAGATGGGPVGSAIGSPAGGGSTGQPGAQPGPKTPGIGTRPDVVASLQFGLLGGRAIERKVAELTPLPSATSPVLVYLGQTKAGHAAFLVSSDVKPSRGRCLPSRDVCSTLHLKAGDVAYLNVATSAGRDLRYRLKFLHAGR